MMNRTTKLILTSLAFALVAHIAGCATAEHATTTNAGSADTARARPAVEPVKDVNEAKPAYRAEFATEPAEVKAGEPVTLSFTVKDAKGAVVRDLQVVHEKPMHLLVVSNDLAEFNHLHPQPQGDGSFKVTHTFPNGGAYKLYADFTAPNASQIVDRLDVNVAGDAPREHASLVADKTTTKTVDGLRVTMRPDKHLRAGEELMLNFAVADARTGKPATDLQPYLGALAHFVIISEDTTDFLHAHPMTKEEMSEAGGAHGGMEHDAKPHAHDAAEMKDEAKEGASPSEVAAHTTFPRAGLYKVWAQFQRGGRVITVPYVVSVAENHTVSANTANSVPADAIKVTLSSKGYEPSRIEAKKGQPVKLAFYRADAENCGGEVVFPSQGIRKKLPVRQTVLVEVTPKETGELAFTCGMGMLRGALVVAD
ncbi:MAG: cupredoxin domain-containing protein [Pyrinomonadaceae bacterium]|nr:cupredoxin domain-containing protein [Pyrinomonadaceae bacterium]